MKLFPRVESFQSRSRDPQIGKVSPNAGRDHGDQVGHPAAVWPPAEAGSNGRPDPPTVATWVREARLTLYPREVLFVDVSRSCSDQPCRDVEVRGPGLCPRGAR